MANYSGPLRFESWLEVAKPDGFDQTQAERLLGTKGKEWDESGDRILILHRNEQDDDGAWKPLPEVLNRHRELYRGVVARCTEQEAPVDRERLNLLLARALTGNQQQRAEAIGELRDIMPNMEREAGLA